MGHMHRAADLFRTAMGEYESGDEIAATLAILGVRGSRNSSETCPLAMVIRSAVGEGDLVVVYAEDYQIGCLRGAMSEAATDFVADFDAGNYPALEG